MNMLHRDVFLKFTGETGTHIEHRVAWDPARFIKAVIQQYADLDPPVRVTSSTQEEHRQHRWGKK